MPKGKTDLKDQEETKSVPLEHAVSNRKVTIGANLSKAEETELIETLARNKEVFVWSASDLKGVSRDIIQHSLDINPKMKPGKHKQRKMSEDRILAAKAVRCKHHQRSQVFIMVSKCSAGAKEEWKDENVHRLHRSKQGMHERSISATKDRHLHR